MFVPKKADRKAALFKLAGGKCTNSDCPLPNHGAELDPCCFDFHHRDPDKKEFALHDQMYSCSWDRVLLELKKCDLLCVICHRLAHKANSPTKQRQKANIGEKTYYDRRKKGLSHDEALALPLQPGKCWHPQDVLTIDRITKPIKQWCKEYKINYNTFKSRTYLRGWPPLKALETPASRQIIIAIGGKGKSISAWCAEYGMAIETYYRRLRSGLTPEDAITRPKRPGKTLSRTDPGAIKG